MNAVTEVEEALRSLASRLQKDGEQRVKLVAACELVLLFHGAHTWDNEMRKQWDDAMQLIHGRPERDATTKTLCNAVRAALNLSQPTN